MGQGVEGGVSADWGWQVHHGTSEYTKGAHSLLYGCWVGWGLFLFHLSDEYRLEVYAMPLHRDVKERRHEIHTPVDSELPHSILIPGLF